MPAEPTETQDPRTMPGGEEEFAEMCADNARLQAERDTAVARVSVLASIFGMEGHLPSLKVAAQALRERAQVAERDRDALRAALRALLADVERSAHPLSLRVVDAARAALAATRGAP
jgi:hypothetical protein